MMGVARCVHPRIDSLMMKRSIELRGADVSGAYDRWAASYDADRNATRDLDAAVVRAAQLDIDGRDVLELGCGTGKNTVFCAERASRVVAMDFSAEMLARARARVRAENVEYLQHDVRDPWPLPAASVDIVIGNLVLEHVADLPGVYAEAARVLRPEGRLFFCELHPFRQLRGGQAHFTDARTGETVHVLAHMHSVSEYVNAGIVAGLTLLELGEHVDGGASPDVPPRLISVLFQRPARAS
jgi:ubiquinone/menaquinone biosynthesis C-methylase UbiE